MTSAVVKVLERTINSVIIKHLEANNIWTVHHFHSGRPVDTNVLELYYHITKLLDFGVPADMILLDFSKAFDKVCHKQLAIKLHAVKVEEKSLFWILDFSLFVISMCSVI